MVSCIGRRLGMRHQNATSKDEKPWACKEWQAHVTRQGVEEKSSIRACLCLAHRCWARCPCPCGFLALAMRFRFMELQRRRLQIVSKAKFKKKLKGPSDVKVKSSSEDIDPKGPTDGNTHEGLKDSSVSGSSKNDDKNEISSFGSHVGLHPALRKKKLHWGLDTKERWERKANM